MRTDQEQELRIGGMSCGHCVAAVKKALESVPGVARAEVEVGRARVIADGEIDRDALAAAIRDAGYELG